MFSSNADLTSLTTAALLAHALTPKPSVPAAAAAAQNSEIQQRTAIENSYTKIVLAVISDYGEGLDPDCNPLNHFGEKHDSDNSRFLQALEWVKLRSKYTFMERVANTEYSKFARRIDGYLQRHHKTNILGTEEIQESRNLLLQLIRDIHIKIEKIYKNKNCEDKITQLEVIGNIIAGIADTAELWNKDVNLWERFKQYLSSEHATAFAALLPELDRDLSDDLEPLYKSYTRNLLPNALGNLSHCQEKKTLPLLRELILLSVTDQKIEVDLSINRGIEAQLSQPHITHEQFRKTDTAQNALGKVLANHENLFALSRNLYASEIQTTYNNLRDEVTHSALQHYQRQQLQAEEPLCLTEEKYSASSGSTEQGSITRIERFKTQYQEALKQAYDDEVIKTYLYKDIREALESKDITDRVKRQSAIDYRNSLKNLIKLYHQQNRLLKTNKNGGVLAEHINTLLTIIMPRKIGELSNYNLIFYSTALTILTDYKLAAKNIAEHNNAIKNNKGREANFLSAWSLASKLTAIIRRDIFHYIAQISASLTKKHIRENTKELLETLALFSAELSLIDIDPTDSPSEASLKNLLAEVYKITGSLPNAPSEAYLIEEALHQTTGAHRAAIEAQQCIRLTQAQLNEAAQRSLILVRVLTQENRIKEVNGKFHLQFRDGPVFLLDNSKSADWLNNFKKMVAAGLLAQVPLALPAAEAKSQPALPPASATSNVKIVQLEEIRSNDLLTAKLEKQCLTWEQILKGAIIEEQGQFYLKIENRELLLESGAKDLIVYNQMRAISGLKQTAPLAPVSEEAEQKISQANAACLQAKVDCLQAKIKNLQMNVKYLEEISRLDEQYTVKLLNDKIKLSSERAAYLAMLPKIDRYPLSAFFVKWWFPLATLLLGFPLFIGANVFRFLKNKAISENEAFYKVLENKQHSVTQEITGKDEEITKLNNAKIKRSEAIQELHGKIKKLSAEVVTLESLQKLQTAKISQAEQKSSQALHSTPASIAARDTAIPLASSTTTIISPVVKLSLQPQTFFASKTDSLSLTPFRKAQERDEKSSDTNLVSTNDEVVVEAYAIHLRKLLDKNERTSLLIHCQNAQLPQLLTLELQEILREQNQQADAILISNILNRVIAKLLPLCNFNEQAEALFEQARKHHKEKLFDYVDKSLFVALDATFDQTPSINKIQNEHARKFIMNLVIPRIEDLREENKKGVENHKSFRGK